MSDLVLVPYADAMLIPIQGGKVATGRNWPHWNRPSAAPWWSAGCRSGCTWRPSGRRWGPMSTTSTPMSGGWPPPKSSARRSMTGTSRTSPGAGIRSRRTRVCQSGVAGRDAACHLARRSVHRHRGLLPTDGRGAVARDVHPWRAIRHRAGQCAGGHPARARTARQRTGPVAGRRPRRWVGGPPSVWSAMTGKTVFTRA